MNNLDIDPVLLADASELGRQAPSRAAILNEWLALTSRCVSGSAASLLVLATPKAEFEARAFWPSQSGSTHLVPIAERSLTLAKPIVEPIENAVALGFPIFAVRVLVGTVVIQVTGQDAPVAEVQASIRKAVEFLASSILGFPIEPAQAADRVALQKEALRLACKPQPFTAATLELANWLANRFGCDRVAIGMQKKREVKLIAISHSAWYDDKSQAVAALENAMEEALEQRITLVVPPLAAARPAISLAHEQVANGMAACSVVLPGRGGMGAGAIYLERGAGRPFSAEEVSALEEIAAVAGPVLELKRAENRWIGGRGVRIGMALTERLRDPRRPALRIGLVVGVLLFCGLTLLDSTWRVGADAAIEGEEQRAISAPFEGFIADAFVKAGAIVKKGQPLAELDRRQTRLDFERWSSEAAQHESRYLDALAKHDRPTGAVSLAQMNEARAQSGLAQDKLDKSLLTAPFDAVVVFGDLSQRLGSPVEQGKVLFELAPLDRYRVIVKVDERDIRAVHVGQRGELVLSGLTDERLPFVVKNISVPEAKDGRNVFRVEAQLDGAKATLRPGMEGVAKIDAGRRSLLWIWLHPAWYWLRLQIWKWTP